MIVNLEKAVAVVVILVVILVYLAADLVVIVAVLKTLVTNLLKVIFVDVGWVCGGWDDIERVDYQS